MTEVHQAVVAARRSYGRLLAWLAWQWRDIAAAEDALAQAFVRALERWPQQGVPQQPEAWLLTAARRELLMAARRQRLADDPTLTVLWPTDTDETPQPPDMADHRLRLMFVCAHPAIDAGLRSALMLQTVLGIDAARIAGAYLVKPEAMTKRLVRGKARIKANGIRFEAPGPDEWAGRLESVLDAIYGAYTLHWGLAQADGAHELAGEAAYLAELVALHLPDEPEALGLAALVGFCEARRSARLDAHGRFVPLDRQDTQRWNGVLIERCNQLLHRAAALSAPGPYQLEAAIQAAHVDGALHGEVPWAGIESLYQGLLAMAPTVGAAIGRAVAVSHRDVLAGLELMDAIALDRVATHQPWWAARADMLARLGRRDQAAQAYGRALALTIEPALRDWLQLRLNEASA